MIMTRGLLFTVAVAAWFLCPSIAVGQGMGGGMGGMGGSVGGGMGHGGMGRGGMGGPRDSDHHKSPSDDDRGVALLPQPPALMPHGGECLTNKNIHYELVYMPLQARLYLFDEDMKPLPARDVHAQMSLNVPPQHTPQKIPFRYVATARGVPEQDCLVAVFDFRQLPDQDTPISFEFSGLPDSQKFLGIWDRHNGTASFKPSFRPSKIRPYVARVMLTEADQAGFRRQQVCPVSGRMLGIDQQAVKVYIGDYPLYLASEDCVAAVRQSPEKYLPRPAASATGR
jgi:hypothetical protein